MKFLKLTGLVLVAYFITGCSSDQKFKDQLEKTLKENPDIIFNTIKENPSAFIQTFQETGKIVQEKMVKERKEQEDQQLKNAFSNPLIPTIDKSTLIRGNTDAPITIVEYSDFECPFCAKGFDTVEAIMKKYPGKVRFIYKHLPLSFHPQAMISAQYYEAIALQSKEKAFKFHDQIFKNQSKLKQGEKFLSKIAKDLKVDLLKLKKDINSELINSRITNDINEAKKFGFSGTPGFILNGIPIKGAFPAEYFDEIISKLISEGQLKI